MKTWYSTKSENYTETARKRFDSKVIKSEGCWVFTGKSTAGCYRQFSFRNKLILAHRMALFFNGVAVPAEMDVLHTCDNPICVNPKHLYLGTHDDNMMDKAKKGRAPAKLRIEQVRFIKERIACGQSCNSLAIQFGVVPHTISDIRDGVTWKYV